MAKGKTIHQGDIVTLEMTMKLDDGEVVNSTEEEGPVTATIGSGDLVPGLEAKLIGLKAGDAFDAVVEPPDAFGEHDGDLVKPLPEDFFEGVSEGETLDWEDEEGSAIQVAVAEISEEGILLLLDHPEEGEIPFFAEKTDEGYLIDYNHPLAGETIHFSGKVLKVE